MYYFIQTAALEKWTPSIEPSPDRFQSSVVRGTVFGDKFDRLVNDTAKACAEAEQAQTAVETAMSEAGDRLDYKLGQNKKEMSEKQKAELKKLADKDKERLKRRKAELKSQDKKAKKLNKQAKEELNEKR